MIHALYWNPATRTAERPPSGELPATHADLPPDVVLWLDLDDPTPDEEALVFRQFLQVHPLTQDDITKLRRDPENGPHFPKVEEFPDYLFVVVNPLPTELRGEHGPPPPSPGKQGPALVGASAAPPTVPAAPPKKHLGMFRISKKSLPQLSAVITRTVLITHHYAPLPCVVNGQAYLARHAANLGRGPDYIFHLVLDGIVDEYAPVVETISDHLDKLEAKMFEQPTQELLSRLLRIKRQVTYLRKTLILEREVLARLIRGEFHLVDDREIVYYRNVFDHLVRYTELIESAREMVSDLMQTHLSAVSNRLNVVMKTLTMISTIGVVCTLIAGIYGMNFETMPELKWQWGYPLALVLMAVAGTGTFLWFKWKKWA